VGPEAASGEWAYGRLPATEFGGRGAFSTAAQLEGSKIFSKQFLERHGIPTAKMYGTYESPSEVYDALNSVAWPVVIKADGLCAGKGVFLAPDFAAAKDFVQRVMEKNELGPAEKRILLEETLEGEELSSSFSLMESGMRRSCRPAITSASSMETRARTPGAWEHTPLTSCCRMPFGKSFARQLSSRPCRAWRQTAFLTRASSILA